MAKTQTSKLLTSKQEIMDSLKISDYLFRKYIEKGMPARYEDGRWIAHQDNIDGWWRKYTNVSMRKVINQMPDL